MVAVTHGCQPFIWNRRLILEHCHGTFSHWVFNGHPAVLLPYLCSVIPSCDGWDRFSRGGESVILAPGLSTDDDIIIQSAWTTTLFSYCNCGTFPSFFLSSLLSLFRMYTIQYSSHNRVWSGFWSVHIISSSISSSHTGALLQLVITESW